jgi:hypothetical protein
MQPIFFNNPLKTPQSQPLFPNPLPPKFDQPVLEVLKNDFKPYIKQEELEQLLPPKKSLIYHKLIQPIKEFSVLKGTPRDALKFEARFEAGNLFLA